MSYYMSTGSPAQAIRMYGTVQAIWDYDDDEGYITKGVATTLPVPITGVFIGNVLDGITITDMFYQGSGTSWQNFIVTSSEVPQNAWGRVTFSVGGGGTSSLTSASATYSASGGTTTWWWQTTSPELIFFGATSTFTFTQL